MENQLHPRLRLRIMQMGAVPIYLNLSWIIFGALIVAFFIPNLTGIFPSLGLPASVALACLFALYCALSVLIHELGHVLVARAYRVEVYEVELNLVGGFTRYRRGMLSSGKEAVMAAAGPLFSFLAAAALFSVYDAAGPVHGYLLLIVARLNLFLALFNLLPVSTLDGGQIVESLLYRATGRRLPGLIVTTVITIALVAGLVYIMFATDIGAEYSHHLGVLILSAAVILFVLINMVRSWQRGLFLDKLHPLNIDQLMQPLPEGIPLAEIQQWPVLSVSTPPETLLNTALSTQAEHFVVMDHHDEAIGFIRAARIRHIIETDPALRALLRKEETPR